MEQHLGSSKVHRKIFVSSNLGLKAQRLRLLTGLILSTSFPLRGRASQSDLWWMDPADRVLQELQREVAQVEPLRHQVAVFQGDLSAYHLEVEALRAEVRALRDQIAPLQEAHVRASARLQPRLVRPAPAIESLTERVLHNQSCFQFLVVALQRTFPHVQWQSLHED